MQRLSAKRGELERKLHTTSAERDTLASSLKETNDRCLMLDKQSRELEQQVNVELLYICNTCRLWIFTGLKQSCDVLQRRIEHELVISTALYYLYIRNRPQVRGCITLLLSKLVLRSFAMCCPLTVFNSCTKCSGCSGCPLTRINQNIPIYGKTTPKWLDSDRTCMLCHLPRIISGLEHSTELINY